METIVFPTVQLFLGRFKSYYVVWKHIIEYFVSENKYMFKSYYVVWKLCRHMRLHKQTTGFKSYYVVWKLRLSVDKAFNLSGLNRTM